MSVVIGGKERPYGSLAVHTIRKRQFATDDVNFLHSAANLLASTMQREAQDRALLESEMHYRTLLDSANDAVFVFELDENGQPGSFMEINSSACRLLGRSGQDLLAVSPADTITPDTMPFTAMLDDLRTKGHLMFEAALVSPQEPPIAVKASTKLIELGGRPTVLLIARDRREHREAKQRQKLLMAELQHRIKNILATLHALVVQMVQSSTSLEGFTQNIERRLRALAATHDLLLRSNFEKLDLRETFLEELAPYAGTATGADLTAAGPTVLLRPDAAQTLGMVFHKLATNASKYGRSACRAGGSR